MAVMLIFNFFRGVSVNNLFRRFVSNRWKSFFFFEVFKLVIFEDYLIHFLFLYKQKIVNIYDKIIDY
jgi:hypothetical protein